MRKFRQGDAPVILYRRGVKLYEFDKDRLLETDDEGLIALLLSLGAVEIVEETPAPEPGGCACDHDDWYTKEEIDRKLVNVAAGGGVDLDAYATRAYVDEGLEVKADKVAVYSREECDNMTREITSAEIDDILFGD